ncbi:hypothetical protein MMPV_006376 [Pyropia vietnamensis]
MKVRRREADCGDDSTVSAASTNTSWASLRPPSLLGGVRFLATEADLLLLAACGSAGLAAFLTLDGSPPRTRLYFPYDGNWQPFTDESVPVSHVLLVLLLGILPGVTLVELALARWVRRVPWPLAILAAWRYAAAVTGSLAMTGFYLEVAWATLGALRPDFASRCLGFGPFAPGVFTNAVVSSNADCTTSSTEKFLNEARRAFPSGHAAGAAVGGVWATAVLLRVAASGVGGVIAQATVVGIHAVWVWVGHVVLSRVIDNRHTVADVSGGVALGVAVGGVAAAWVSGAVGRLEAKLSSPGGGRGRGRQVPRQRDAGTSVSGADEVAAVAADSVGLSGVTSASQVYSGVDDDAGVDVSAATPAGNDTTSTSSDGDVSHVRRVPPGGLTGEAVGGSDLVAQRGDVAITL